MSSLAPREEQEAALGLHSPEGTPLEAMQMPRRWTRGRIALQALGLVVGLGLLAWALSLALGEGNRRSLEAMRHAPAWQALLLVALTATSVVLNGLMFWAVLRPVRKLAALDVVCVNTIATFLSILPFKLGLLMRALIHHRRDGVRFGMLVSWVAAMAALALSVLLPLGAAGLWRGRIDALWWITAAGGIVACNALGVVLGRLASRGWPILHRLSFGADAMVRHPGAVGVQAVIRIADIAVLAARFLVAAMIADRAMTPDQALLLATTYFLITLLTPAGTLGFREMGVAALGPASGLDHDAVALIVVIVSACDVATAGALSLPAALRLRPDRLLLRR